MKESITKFDLEAAFKALDEIDIPKVKGLRPNKMDLSEATNRVDRTSMLVEDYYNLNSQEDLQEASEDREAEVAKAKLARIEKIVDLNADTEDAILPSYVGKIIMQCPQCMTLFYKDEADIKRSEDDETIVNVGEACQHCGNKDGYTLIGKVAEETPEELSDETTEEETVETEELPELEGEEATEENTEEGNNSEEENTEELPDLEELPLSDEEETKEEAEEEEEKNESLNRSELLKDIEKKNELASENTSENLTLNEDLDTDMTKYNAYIDYIQAQIKADEEELKKAGDNQLIKDAIQKKLDAHKADLESALPPVVKDVQAEDELPTPEEAKVEEQTEETETEKEVEETEEKTESLNNSEVLKNIKKENELATENASENTTLNEACDSCKEECINEEKPVEITYVEDGKGGSKEVCPNCGKEICECNKALTEEDISLTYSDEAIEDMFNSKEFKTPISDAEVEGYLVDDKAVESLNKIDDIQESSFNKYISDYLTEVYSNVDNFEMTNCQLDSNKLVVEGIINFKSGNTKETSFTFKPRANQILEGYNKDIAESTNAFKINYSNQEIEGCGNTLITEGIEYNYSIENSTVKGRK